MRKSAWIKNLPCLCLLLFAAAAGAETLSGNGSLFASEKNYQLGDLVTVIVAESAEGAQSASTDLHKQTSLGLSTGGQLGVIAPSANLGLDSKQSGGGDLSRHGHMTATLTARVEKILANGCLSLAGEQDIEFDSGRQHLSVHGVARPRDISPDNEIYSFRLSDAKIEFTGRDALHEKARTGFLSRFLEWLWIF
jgi:flagellar L-ring protein FlgH